MANEQDQEKINEVSEPDVEQTPQETPAEETASEPVKEAAGASKEEDAGPPPDIYSMLHFMLGMIAEQAWMFMGIRLAPGQKEPVKDMIQAKVAIDTVVFISDKLHPKLSEEERKMLRGLISDLQMNFVVHDK